MTRVIIDVLALFAIFSFGVTWTVVRLGKQDRLVFSIVAVLSPALVILSFIRIVVLKLQGKLTLTPCPDGLLEAEKEVALERQRLFGGQLSEPIWAERWQRAYQAELRREAEQVQEFTERVLVGA